MYEEKKVKIPFRDIALQILIIVLFILILLWLFPTKKNVNKYVKKNDSNSNTQENGTTNDPTKDNSNKNGNSNNNNNNGTNNGSKNNNSGKETDNKTNNNVMYEYVKEEAGTYGSYGAWSDWSTNYVASSDTVDVQTDVRRVASGTSTYQVKVGTSITNEVIGNIKDKKVFAGYKAKYIRDLTSSLKLNTVDDYIYILTSGVQKYDCDGKTYEFTLRYSGSINLSNDISYDNLIKITNNFEPSDSSSILKTCTNIKLINESYNYKLYQKEPVYTTSVKDVYGDVETPIMETKTSETYTNVTYYRYRTRTYTAGTKDTKWSNSANDQTLLNQGYKLTGNKK